MKIKVTNIKWDTDGDNEMASELPKVKCFKLPKKLRENYGREWPVGRPKIYVTRYTKEEGLAFTPVKINRWRKESMYFCSEKTWNMMPSRMKSGFERI